MLDRHEHITGPSAMRQWVWYRDQDLLMAHSGRYTPEATLRVLDVVLGGKKSARVVGSGDQARAAMGKAAAI
jgi:hypothetical protein